MATRPDARGAGAGTGILQALVQYGIAHGATRVWCNARTPALSLYARVGFAVASDEFSPPDIGPHHRMELPVAARRG
jgi:predicted GNAT family N-acyltransferase